MHAFLYRAAEGKSRHHLTSVFNSQSQIQLGGRWNHQRKSVERPFRGVMAGVLYNDKRPLDLAAENDKVGSAEKNHFTD